MVCSAPSRRLSILAVVVAVAAGTARAADSEMSPPTLSREIEATVGTSFTYQGHLLLSGAPADGLFDFEFRLMDAAAGGGQIGSTVAVDDAAVTDGRFTVALDFGTAAFGGGARWLDIAVRPGAGGTYTPLSPRQALTPAPYALALPNVYTDEVSGFVGVGRSNQLTAAERFGVHSEATAGNYGGMYVETSDPASWPFYGFATAGSYRAWMYYDGSTSTWRLYNGGARMSVPSGGGLVIESTTTTDGIRVNQTADDGAQIGNGTDYPNYGVYVPSPGVPNICLLVYTANANGNYALYTSDNIEAGTVTATAQKVIARVDAATTLSRGDVAVASGVTDPLEGGSDRLALVRRSGSDPAGVIGVVAGRLEWQQAPGKEAEGERILMPVEGPARPGDIVEIVVQGVTDVHVQRGARITRGARVTAFETDGGVRPLRVESLNGMPVTEGAPVVGVALADAGAGDTVPVFVNVH